MPSATGENSRPWFVPQRAESVLLRAQAHARREPAQTANRLKRTLRPQKEEHANLRGFHQGAASLPARTSQTDRAPHSPACHPAVHPTAREVRSRRGIVAPIAPYV